MKNNILILLVMSLVIQFSGDLFAQDVVNIAPDQEQNVPTDNDKLPDAPLGSSVKVGWISSFEFGISISVLFFGILVFVMEYIFLRTIKFDPEQSIKLISITLIIISTLFVITAGFDSEQIAPAMGLFGTIAGYVLGRSAGANEGDDGVKK